jgi:TonB family protein
MTQDFREQDFREPELSPAARRVLAALLLSLALHAVLFGWVGVRQQVQRAPVVLQVRLSPSTHSTAKDNPLLSTASLSTSPAAADKLQPAQHVAVPEKPSPAVQAPVPVLNTPVLVDTHYYLARELDVLPVPVHAIVPIAPTGIPAGEHGWVRLRVRLDDMGRVTSVKVEDSNPPEVFDRNARDAFEHKLFQPGIRNGQPVYSELEIKVFF